MTSHTLPLPTFLLLVAALFFSAFASSEPACMKTVSTEEDINICQYSEAKRLLLELNDLENAIQTHLQGSQGERFEEAQTRWRQMTEKDCELEADFYEGAGIYPAIHSECLQRHYLDRMATLKKYLCPEPNLGHGCEAAVSQITTVPASPPAASRNKLAETPNTLKQSKRFR